MALALAVNICNLRGQEELDVGEREAVFTLYSRPF